MSWTTIALAECQEEFASPSEQAALTSAAGASDKLASILARTVNSVRGVIEAAGGALGAANTIPDSLRPEVIAIARWRWLIAFAALRQLQTEERRKAYEEAVHHLEQVAGGTRPVESPTSGPSGVNQIETFSDNSRRATRAKLSGL